jgi:hypothetical protein
MFGPFNGAKGTEYFWLCGECSRNMRVTHDREGAVPAEREGANATGTSARGKGSERALGGGSERIAVRDGDQVRFPGEGGAPGNRLRGVRPWFKSCGIFLFLEGMYFPWQRALVPQTL